MKKNYKDFEKVYIGSSDTASLTLKDEKETCMLHFGGDAHYSAYFCTDDIDIPEHYRLVFTGKNWIKIYDDEGYLTKEIKGDEISVYRAGQMGALIHVRGVRA